MKIQPLTCRDGREHGGWTRMNTDFQFQRFSICPLFQLSDFQRFSVCFPVLRLGFISAFRFQHFSVSFKCPCHQKSNRAHKVMSAPGMNGCVRPD